jgi:hypothetical protein
MRFSLFIAMFSACSLVFLGCNTMRFEDQVVQGRFDVDGSGKESAAVHDANGSWFVVDLDLLQDAGAAYEEWDGQMVQVSGTVEAARCKNERECMTSVGIKTFVRVDEALLLGPAPEPVEDALGAEGAVELQPW